MQRKLVVAFIVTLLFAVYATIPEQVSPPPSKQAAVSNQAAAASQETASVNNELVKKGYAVSKRHNQLMYCRAEAMTGTRFKSTVCQTEDQIMVERGTLPRDTHATFSFNSVDANNVLELSSLRNDSKSIEISRAVLCKQKPYN